MFSRIESIERLADEGGHDARSTFLRVALEQFLRHEHRPTHSEIERFSDLCLALIEHVDSSTRHLLATRLSPYHYAPTPVLERLLLDANPVVSDEVIRRSCHFTHAELQQICMEGKVRHACAIAERQDLDLTLVRLLVQHPNEKVVLALIGNLNAPFDAEAIRIIIQRIHRGDVESGLLLQRKDIPALWLAGLYSYAQAEERSYLRTAIGAEAGPPELPIPQETYPLLYTAMLRKDIVGLRHALARMLRLSPESTHMITDDETGELLALALLAVGLDEQQTAHVLRFVVAAGAKDGACIQSMLTGIFQETSRRSARRIVSAVSNDAPGFSHQPHMLHAGAGSRYPLPLTTASASGIKTLLRQSER